VSLVELRDERLLRVVVVVVSLLMLGLLLLAAPAVEPELPEPLIEPVALGLLLAEPLVLVLGLLVLAEPLVLGLVALDDPLVLGLVVLRLGDPAAPLFVLPLGAVCVLVLGPGVSFDDCGRVFLPVSPIAPLLVVPLLVCA
jgi:hypothetical protein